MKNHCPQIIPSRLYFKVVYETPWFRNIKQYKDEKDEKQNLPQTYGVSGGIKSVTNTAEEIHLIPLYTKYQKPL